MACPALGHADLVQLAKLTLKKVRVLCLYERPNVYISDRHDGVQLPTEERDVAHIVGGLET